MKTYRLTDERSEVLAADVVFWYGGFHAVFSLAGILSTLRLIANKRLDIQVPLLLGSAAASQVATLHPGDHWRQELHWLRIVSGSLAIAHLGLAIYIQRTYSSNFLVDVINGIQHFINK